MFSVGKSFFKSSQVLHAGSSRRLRSALWKESRVGIPSLRFFWSRTRGIQALSAPPFDLNFEHLELSVISVLVPDLPIYM